MRAVKVHQFKAPDGRTVVSGSAGASPPLVAARYAALLSAAALTGAVLAAPGAVGAPSISARVVGVSDGDTLTVQVDGGRQARVRLADVDAPEKGQDFGQASKAALSRLCFGRTAQLEILGSDRYGRSLARVRCDGVDAAANQVRTGMAWAYRRYLTRADLLDLEAGARAGRSGLWSHPSPTPPWEFRRGSKRSVEQQEGG